MPDIDWVKIPAGEFIYGEGKSQTTLSLDAFEIARYPVTNAQYQCFVEDDGYADERWWQGLEKPEIRPSVWPQSNRPRTYVDWYEVTAFARWMSARLNEAIRLPFEHEWEKAARGTDGRAYPWGAEYVNGHANVNESRNQGDYLKQTTAVGLFPHDESPYKARDMAGNVWEWCNEFNPNQTGATPTETPSPGLRGGSWDFDPDDARAAYRFRYRNPDGRYNYLGFRLLRSRPS